MKKLSVKEWVAVGAAIVATIALFFGGTLWSLVTGASSSQDAARTLSTASGAQEEAAALADISTVPGVEVYDIKVGTGEEAARGDIVTTHYVGTLVDGTRFDSSRDRGTPYSFVLGMDRVIEGWHIGVAGMKVGGVRRLVISPEYAYGNQPIGSIPAGSTLVFEVELLSLRHPAP